jgi:hypothetical protein
LAAYGAVTLAVAVAAFLVSPMVMDLFSARYLAAIVLAMPFALAPVAARLPFRSLAGVLAPYLVSAAVAGWLGFGERVHGLAWTELPGGGALDEEHLGDLLRARGVSQAVADYWVSYRLTFLYQEAISVIPIHAREDRYAPYRRAFESAPRVAYIFDPRRSRGQLAPMLDELRTQETYGKPAETLQVGELTALILERPLTLRADSID